MAKPNDPTRAPPVAPGASPGGADAPSEAGGAGTNSGGGGPPIVDLPGGRITIDTSELRDALELATQLRDMLLEIRDLQASAQGGLGAGLALHTPGESGAEQETGSGDDGDDDDEALSGVEQALIQLETAVSGLEPNIQRIADALEQQSSGQDPGDDS